MRCVPAGVSVEEATHSDGHIKVKTHRAQEALVELLEIANQRDARITSLEILEPATLHIPSTSAPASLAR